MKRIMFLLAASFFVFQLNSFASTKITNDTADFKLTPAGASKFATVKAGSRIPVIYDNSTIEIVNKGITVATTFLSKANLSILGNMIAMNTDNTLDVTINTNGAIKVHDSRGLSTIKTFDGKTIYLKEGQTVILAGRKATNVEPYSAPAGDIGPVNTGVQIEEKVPDISPVS